MSAITRLGLWGHNTRRTGSFAGKPAQGYGPHPVGKITRMGMWGHNTQRCGSFAGKTPHTPTATVTGGRQRARPLRRRDQDEKDLQFILGEVMPLILQDLD